MKNELTKRQFFRTIFATYGIHTLLNQAQTAREHGVLKGIQNHLMVTRLGQPVITSFQSADIGQLMSYYQDFFGIFVRGASADDIHNFATLAFSEANLLRERQKAGGKHQNWHRAFSLQAVAPIHCLTELEGSELGDVRRLIIKSHDSSLSRDSEFCNREVLEILWQNMICALTKDPDSWLRFEAGQDIIRAAERLCVSFLEGDSANQSLLQSATLSWQFLLTYEHALAQRKNQKSIRELAEVRRAKAQINGVKARQMIWLAEIERLYSGRSGLEDMLPQSTETLMCRSQLLGKDKLAADLFVVLWLQKLYDYDRVASGKIPSIFSTAEREQQTVESSFRFLADYGVAGEDWPELKVFAQKFLSKETLAFGEARFQVAAHYPTDKLREAEFRLLHKVVSQRRTRSRRFELCANRELLTLTLNQFLYDNADVYSRIMSLCGLTAGESSCREEISEAQIQEVLPFDNSEHYAAKVDWHGTGERFREPAMRLLKKLGNGSHKLQPK